MKQVLLVPILSMILGCSTVTPQIVQHQIPDRPILSPIMGSELACISDGTYNSMVQSRRLLLNHIETLETLLSIK